MLAWVLVRYSFPASAWWMRWWTCPSRCPRGGGHRAHRAVCAQRLVGQHLEPLGIKVAFTPLGVLVALIFIGLPFVVRTCSPSSKTSTPSTRRPP